MKTTKQRMDERFAGMEIQDYAVETIEAVVTSLTSLPTERLQAERYDLATLLLHAVGAVQRERDFAASR